MSKQLEWKPFSSPSSKVKDQTQAVWELAQRLQNRAEKVEYHAEEIEKLLAEEAPDPQHPVQVDQLRAWYCAKAGFLHQRKTFLILHEEWRRITAWSQIQKEKKAGKYSTFCSDAICSYETYAVLEVLWRFLETETQAVGKFAYVTYGGDNPIYVIDIDSRVIDTIFEEKTMSEITYKGIAITPDGTQAYAVGSGEDNCIFVIDTDINRVITTISVNGILEGVAVTPDGNRAYAVIGLDYPPRTVTVTVVIATDSHTVIAAIGTRKNSRPKGIAISPDGTKVYVISEECDSRNGVISIIATDSHQVTAAIPVEKSPRAIAITSNGVWAYVTHFEFFEKKGIVSVIDTNIKQVIVTIHLEEHPNKIVITPNGARAYVTLWNRKVAVIDINSNTVIDVIKGEESEKREECEKRKENQEGVFRYSPYKDEHCVVAITRDGTQVWMTDLDDNISIYSLNSHKVIDTIKCFSGYNIIEIIAIGQLT
jgi:YVTN family beta-propeller protein